MNLSTSPSQRAITLAHLQATGMARLCELSALGVTAATLSRLEREGTLTRLTRGLYQRTDASLDANHTLATVAKRIPKGVICLSSALAFHGLTDQIPAKVWVAIAPKAWRPILDYPPVRIARFSGENLLRGIENHTIDGASVPIFNVAKTVADMFRYRQTVGVNLALEGLREALRQNKATPAEIAQAATEANIWRVVEPYLQALISHA